MSPEKLKRQAQRLVCEGLKRSAALNREAFKDRRMANLMLKHEADGLINSARMKFQRAARLRSFCSRMAAQHGITPNANGQGMASLAVAQKTADDKTLG